MKAPSLRVLAPEQPLDRLNELFSSVKRYAEAAGRDPESIELWTSGTADRELLDALVGVGVSQVMVPARAPDQLEERYAQLIADYA